MAKRVVKGKAFNIAPGMVLFKGKNPNKTDDIDVGPNNPKKGISVDNNEVGIGFIASKDGKSVTPISNTIKILSNQPMLGGVSPVQLLYGGMAPDKVFAMQEAFKDVHGINDDGSKAQFGGDVNLDKLVARINSTSNADFVKRLKDPNRKYIRKGDNIYTHLLGYVTAGDKAIVYPEVQSTNKGLKIFEGRQALNRAIENKDTLHMSIPEAEAFTTQYKDYYPGFKFGGRKQFRDGSKAQFGILKKIKEKLSGKSNNSQTPVKEPEYVSYFDATDEQKSHLINKKGKYNIESVGDYGDTHFGVVEARYKSLTDSMRRKGFTSEEIDRLSPFLITQQILEGGYKLTNDTNNFGGILIPGTNKKMSFKSVDDFNDYYLSNLDEKWGDDYLGKGKGWRNAKTLKEYADIINREDLRLYTKEAHSEYNRQHKDKPAYIYTPLWENNNTGLMSEPKFGGIYPRVSGMIDLLKTRIEDWNNMAKTNNIVKKQFGGRKKFNLGGDDEDKYNTLLNAYNVAAQNRKTAIKTRDEIQKAFYDYQDALPDNIRLRNNYYWKNIPELRKLGAKLDNAKNNVSETTKAFLDAKKKIGDTTINKYKGTNADLLAYPGWSNTEEGAKKYLIEDGVRESIGAQEVADYFNSYVSSPGFQRIIDNQISWGQKRHPYRKIYNLNYTKSGFSNAARQFRNTLLDKPMTTFGVFDIDSYPGMGFNYSQYAPYNHIIINAAGNPFLNQQEEQFPYWYELTHEMLHDYNFTNDGQGEALDQNKNTKSGHDSWRNEKHSDLEALRFMLYKYNIYDSRGDKDAKAEDIKKLRDMFPKLRPLEQMDDETAAWMINHVASTNKSNKEDKRNKAQFGGQTNVNSLGERPNAKYRKQMKNKRNKAALGRQQFNISGLPAFDFTIPNSFGNYNLNKPFYPTYVDGPLIGLRVPQSTLNVPAFSTNFAPKSTVGQVDPFMGTKPAFGTSITGTPATNPVGDLTKSGGLSTTTMSAIGAGINTLGALIGSGIQQWAINGLKAPKRQYTLLSPVKLKTKININPQIARMREMQAQLADAARRTSGSSRTAYQKILANYNRLLDSAMDLYGRKENIETELINRDRLNQQQVAHTNATNVMNTINYNNEATTEMRNRKRVATSNNWTTALNTTAGAWAGPNGFIDRANALRVKAGELYTQAIANPTAARLLYGDIDFTTGANKRRAFNTIYDFLNNNRFA